MARLAPRDRGNSRHNDPTVIFLGENLRLGSENQLVKYERGSYNINKVTS